jgi:hypothetical protein
MYFDAKTDEGGFNKFGGNLLLTFWTTENVLVRVLTASYS